MKSLDEVITKLEDARVQVETGTGYWVDYRDNDDLKADALHYLKVLQKMQKAQPVTKGEWDELYNRPLTWDELKAKEGKPVWVEDEDSYSRWEIINGVYDDGISFVGNYYLNKNEFGTVWQAYRKERG